MDTIEDLIDVTYEGGPIPVTSQDAMLLIKSKPVDFLGIENFNFVFNPLLIDVANKLIANEKKFYSLIYQKYRFQNWIRLLNYLKYRITWSVRFQFLK